MKVFKFGGASVNNIDRIRNVAAILSEYQDTPLVVIISAMGKTTNALEKVVEAFFRGEREQALELFHAIKQQHLTTAKYLLVQQYNPCYSQLNDFFTEVEWLLYDQPVRGFDYYYDQVVCVGELLSTCIISHFLREVGIANQWLDVRDILRTDDNFRDATVNWEFTGEHVRSSIPAEKPVMYLTQGFIGATDENESTTLGREGSDYTAAIFANILAADNLTIWKDVEGVMSADPKQFPDATFLRDLSYREVIEMAYYGAQVIHPKTIKPLQNKNIPLQVKCFLDPSLPGTTISGTTARELPPIIVIKENQVLVHLYSQDFSFVGEKPMSQLYGFFAKVKLKPNLVQTGAISVQLCLDDHPEKIDQLAAAAASVFDVELERGLSLLTIRYSNAALLEKMTAGKTVLLQQETTETVQVLYR